MSLKENKETCANEFESDKVSAKELFGYNMAALPAAFFTGFMGQIQAFYYGWLGLRPEWIILAQILFAIWNVLNDPLFGILMDRTKHKQGRYIPWIKWSAPLFTIGFIMVFFPPVSWGSKTDALFSVYQVTVFFWYLISQVVYDTFFTIVFVAHTALLPQMTMCSTERTRVAVIYGILALIGGAASGGLPLIFLVGATAAKIRAFQIFVVIFGLAALAAWVFVVKWVKERQEYLPETHMSVKKAIKEIFTNPAGRIYIVYDAISVGIMNTLLACLPYMLGWIFGQEHGYDFMTLLVYFGPAIIAAVLGAILQINLPKKKDLKTALWIGMLCEAVGFFIAFLGALPAPNAPQDSYALPGNMPLLAIGTAIGMFGFPSDLVQHNPFRGDVVDYDEFITGERSEAVYSGVGCIFSKPMQSVVLILVPVILSVFGLRPVDQYDPETALVVALGYPSAITGVAVATFLVPAILATIGVITWYWNPLGRKKLDEIHVVLQELHEKKRAERLDEDGHSKFVKRKAP